MSNENPSLSSFNSSHTITCNFCGKYGHIEAICFRKVGFPFGNIKPQSFLLLEKSALFVIVLATPSTPVVKSMGFVLATNSAIGHPKPII